MSLPDHLKIKIPLHMGNIEKILIDHNISTVCKEASCPNKSYCFSKKVATFLALGNYCTRSCAFCNVKYSKNPPPLDENEPEKIALCAKELKLEHIVITMVTRDDLEDKGANQIAKIVREVKKHNKNSSIEVLVSDFSKKFDLIDIVLNEKVDIYNHNIETVESLTPKIRHLATYRDSLEILKYVKNSKKVKFVKSGFMVGLSEIKNQVFHTINDLYKAKVDIVTIGQYLQPSKNKFPVKKFISLEEFKEYEEYGKKIGIKNIYSAPFVRSSFNAKDILNKAKLDNS